MTASRLTARARREDILLRTTAGGPSTVEALAARYDVTPSTIRRDLAQLGEQGLLARTYGGVIPLGGGESSLPQRSSEAMEAKRAIASEAYSRLAGASTVILDAGSTVSAVAPFVSGSDGLRVVTTNLAVITELSDDACPVEVIGVAGRLRRPSQGFVGPLAEAVLERVHADVAFLGTDAITPYGELCEMDLEQTRLKEIMGRRADRTYVLAHGAKLGTRVGVATLPLPRTWGIITDASAPDAAVAGLRERGLEVVVAGEAPEGGVSAA